LSERTYLFERLLLQEFFNESRVDECDHYSFIELVHLRVQVDQAFSESFLGLVRVGFVVRVQVQHISDLGEEV